MPTPTLWSQANILWLVFCLYFLSNFRPIRTKSSSAVSVFSVERLCLLLTAPFAFFPRTHLGPFALHFHHSQGLGVLGFVLVVAGLAFSAWARDVLGRNWSGRVVIQDGHQLVTAGPYAYIRHPLYTGLLVGIAGMSLIAADLGSVLGFLFAVAFFWLKASREERMLENEFGPAYTYYRSHTGALLPRLNHV